MGYNTVAVFCNDLIDLARKDSERVIDAIHARALGNDREHVPYGISVLPPYHADIAPILIGGANNLKMLAQTSWLKKDDIPTVLREIARQNGYEIAIRKYPAG